MNIDRRAFLSSLGTAVAIEAMSSEALADALEHHMIERLDQVPGAQLGERKERPYRRGIGSVFVLGGSGDGVFPANKLEPMPPSPTLLDFFKLRFAPANHVLQSATRALKTGMNEETILACLLHDVVLSLMKPDHGWWGAQLIEPYVSER